MEAPSRLSSPKDPRWLSPRNRRPPRRPRRQSARRAAPCELSRRSTPSTFPSQLVWFAIAFGLLYWFMSKRALPQLGAVIEDRKARIASDLDDATAMQQQADAAAAAHEKTLAEARAKAQSLAQAARDQLAAEPRPSEKTLEDELAAKLAAAEQPDRDDARPGDDQCRRDRARRRRRDRRAACGRPADPEAVAAAVDSVKSLRAEPHDGIRRRSFSSFSASSSSSGCSSMSAPIAWF